MMTKQNPAKLPLTNQLPLTTPPPHICFCKTHFYVYYFASSHSGPPSTDLEELAHKSLVKPLFGAQTLERDLLRARLCSKPEFSSSLSACLVSHQVKELLELYAAATELLLLVHWPWGCHQS